MTSMELDEASLSMNKEEIELKVPDSTENSFAESSQQYDKKVIGSIDLFEFSGLKSIFYNAKTVNNGRVGRCSF